MLISLQNILDDYQYQWIQKSNLFNTLYSINYEELTDLIELPICQESETNIQIILNVIKYWDVTYLPITILHSIRHHDDKIQSIINHYPDEERLFYDFFINVQNVPSDIFYEKMIIYNREDILYYANHYHYKFDKKILIQAVQNGWLTSLIYLHSHNLLNQCYNELVTVAIQHGQLDCLIYLHIKKNYSLTVYHSNIAIKYGQLNCLIYLNEHSYMNYELTNLLIAIQFGQMHCLKYLHENGCQLDELCIIGAIYNDDVTCLQYLHENNCPCNPCSYQFAKQFEKSRSMQYIQNNMLSIMNQIDDSDSHSVMVGLLLYYIIYKL